MSGIGAAAHTAHAIDMGTRFKGLIAGVRPFGREVDGIVDDLAKMRSKLTAVNHELQQRPPYDIVIERGRRPWSDGMRGVILKEEYAGRAQLIDDLVDLDKLDHGLYARGERLERSIAHRHPELVKHHQWSEESLGSLLGGLIGGSSGRTYKQVTRTAQSYPAEIQAFRSAEQQLGRADLRGMPGKMDWLVYGTGRDDVLTFRLPPTERMHALDQAVDGLRNLARQIGEPARR